MKALQLIYASWKNGNSQEKGFMIYSKSEGISDSEYADIKDAMKYVPPRDLTPTPSQDEIRDEFPYNFSYFQLHSGKVCVSLTTYLGRDYSNRFGNYLIHALVLDPEELTQYPAQFFGEEFLKTEMTEEELNAESPVPPLPPLDIDYVGNVLDEETVTDFVIANIDTVKYFISAALTARRDRVPMYLNDTRENLVLWMSVLEMFFPVSVAKKIYFGTYIFNHDSMRRNSGAERAGVLDLQGIRPDANGFDYHNAAFSANQIVMDEIGGTRTGDIRSLRLAEDLTEDFTIGRGEITEFGEYLDSVGCTEYDYGLEYAYRFFKLKKYKKIDDLNDAFLDFLKFGETCLPEEENKDAAIALLEICQSRLDELNKEETAALIRYLYKYAAFMSYSTHGMLLDYLSAMAEESEKDNEVFSYLDKIREDSPEAFRDFLLYFASGDVNSQQQMYMDGNPDRNLNGFISKLIVRNYGDTRANPGVWNLLDLCISNLAKLPDAPESMKQLLSDAKDRSDLLVRICGRYVSALQGSSAVIADAAYSWAVKDLGQDQADRFFGDLLNDPETTQLGIDVTGRNITGAQDPGYEFWRFYESNRQKITSGGDLDFTSILDVYTGMRLDSRDALQLLERMDQKYLEKYGKVNRILELIENEPVKRICTMSLTLLERAEEIAKTCGLTVRIPKIIAVVHGEKAKRKTLERISFRECTKDAPIDLFMLRGKDYKEYLDRYLETMVGSVMAPEDLKELFGQFCSDMESGVFYDYYTDALKNMHKNSGYKWFNLMATTSVMLIESRSGSARAAGYEQDFFRYLRKIKEDEFERVKKMTADAKPGPATEAFFEKALEKETFMDRFGGFWKGKK